MTLASRASSAGGVSPIGEPVPRLPPRVAPLRISRDANCGNTSASSGTEPASPRSISVRVSAPPRSIRCRRSRGPRSSSSRSRPMVNRARAVPDVQLDAPVGGTGHQLGVGIVGQQVEGLREVQRPDVVALAAADPGRGGGRGGLLAAGPERVVEVGVAERVRGVLDRPVAGAAAEVAAQRVQVEAVGAVFVIGRLTGSNRIDVAVARAALGRGAVGVGLGLGGALGVTGRPVDRAGRTRRPSSR